MTSLTSANGGRPVPAVRVFTIDDHDLVRRGLQDILYFEDGLEVVGEADGVASALAALAGTAVDVAVVDLMLTDGTGIDICRWIHATKPETACLIITSLDDTTALRATILAGAAGYVSKLVMSTDAAGAIRQVAAGRMLVDRTLFAGGHAHLREICETDDRLSDQERAVFARALDGDNDREIAAKLGLTVGAVTDRIAEIVDKVELIRSRTSSRAPAVAAG
jgi:two-component system response regulator DevR